MNMANDIIHAMDKEAATRKYFALSVCLAFPDRTEKLIHFCDEDRYEQFAQARNSGAIAIGMFFIFHCLQFGYVAGCRCFTDDPMWKHIFDRERTIMTNLLSSDSVFRNIISECNPKIH